jgi:pimeloyl-ACP methyl ester carboxylesterase
MAAAVKHTEQLVEAAGLSVELRRGGSGTPLLVLHGEFGVPGWLEAYQQLAETRDVIVPSLPGYGRTTRPDWIMGAHDLAAWVTWFVGDLNLPTPIDVIGCSLGGWVAAEVAIASPLLINRMVLVGAMGIKPDKGEIFDYFLEGGLTGFRRAFLRPNESSEFGRYFGHEWTPQEADLVEQHREMTCRIAWKPYMHSLTLRHFLPAIKVQTLLIWGQEDAVTPLDSGEIYNRGIRDSRLTVIKDCGHMPEMEKPGELAYLVREFLG